MSNLKCINCQLNLLRMRRHALGDESEDVVNTIRLWTYPRNITLTDHICHACWQLVTYRDVPDSKPSKQIGHRHVCVVCGRSIARRSRRRVLIAGANEQEQRLAHIVSDWIQPRELSSHDEACVPCWLKARRRAGTIRPQPDVRLPVIPPHGVLYQDVMCAVCGQSLTSVLPYVKQLRPEDIARLSELRQISAVHEVCAVCWEQAQDVVPQTPRSQEPETESPQQTATGLRDTDIPQVTERRRVERPQYITLPNMRRAADTPRHCIFHECRNIERHTIPQKVRYRVLQQFQYYIPNSARICTEHLQEADFQNLYSAEYSMKTFTATHIEDIIFILMEIKK
ncbi:unnamed protein product [Spodoptera littoralis]|uniref:Uncharacterized protein n=1 Tax=Spodoptera littoralis TaxID=7109 RepID=A0A9P0I309_SPOLI|nr:unnamed protein product [Spodoptera littoralis]CAH1639238.1 unnamed protein product [Spodoptera littoralis]